MELSMTAPPRYEIEMRGYSIREDDLDSRFLVRRNGKVFFIEVSPSNFVNSPNMTEKLLTFNELLKSGDEELGDICEEDVDEWVLTPFEPYFAELAPDPQCDNDNIRISLKGFLFPEFFDFALDVINEERHPRRITENRAPDRPSFLRFEDDLLDDLETWTVFFDPANIAVSYLYPVDALFKHPRKVLIDNGQTECFFKPSVTGIETRRELESYKKINAAALPYKYQVCRLHGVVLDDSDFILGLLLTYIDGQSLANMIIPNDLDDPPASTRECWLAQINDAVTALHDIGVVWGDVKASNVLIQGDNAWVIDFGGGYTKGWVDRDVAETFEGDVMGMDKMKQFLIPGSVVCVS